MKSKARRNLKKNNKFNYKKHWLIFVGGRDVTVDELTPEQELENFKAWEKLLWERTRENDVDFDVAVDKNEEKIIKDSAEEWANQVVGRWHEMQKEKNR